MLGCVDTDMDPAPVTLLYFAWLRERIGLAEERRVLPPQIDRVDRLIGWLSDVSAAHAAAFARRAALRCAINQHMAQPDSPVGPGDEIAFFPPVTGG